MMRILAMFALLGPLAACTGPGASMPSGGGSTMPELQQADKLYSDELASGITGMDCDVQTISVNGSYCIDRKRRPAPPPEVTCYRSLGTVDCVQGLDPNRPGTTPITYPKGTGPADIKTPMLHPVPPPPLALALPPSMINGPETTPLAAPVPLVTLAPY